MADRTVRIKYEAVTAGYQRAVRGMGSSNEKFGRGAQLWMSRANLAMGAVGLGAGVVASKLAGFVSSSVDAFRDFESANTKLVTQIGLSRAEADRMGASVLSLRDAGRGPQELASAMFFVQSAGLRGAAALDVVEASGRAAAIGLGDTATVADLTTSAMNAYGAETLSAEQATDILIGTVQQGKAEAPELASALGRVLPIASQMGVSFDEVGAAVAGMTRTGTDAGEAVTNLRSILQAILAPSEQAHQLLSQVGLSSEDLTRTLREDGLLATLQLLRESFADDESLAKFLGRQEALLGMLDLTGANAAETEAIFAALGDTTGLLAEGFEEWGETGEAAVQNLSDSMERLKLTVGAAAAPAMNDFAELVSDTIEVTVRAAEVVDRLGDAFSRALAGLLEDLVPTEDALGAVDAAFAGVRAGIENAIPGVGQISGGFSLLRGTVDKINEVLDYLAVLLETDEERIERLSQRVDGWEASMIAAHDAADETTESTEELTAATEEQAAAIEDLAAAFESWQDPAGVYRGVLEELEEAERDAAETRAEMHEDGSRGWEDFVTDVAVSMSDYVEGLDAHLADQEEHQRNLLTIISRGRADIAAEFVEMTEENIAQAALFAGGTDAEFQAGAEAWDATFGAGMTDAQATIAAGMVRMQEIAARGGRLTAAAVTEELDAGMMDVIRVSNRYGISMSNALAPLLDAIGSSREAQALREYVAGRRVGGRIITGGLNTGGLIRGIGGDGPNMDSMLAFLTPREFVVQRPVVDEQGVARLQDLNAGRADIVPRFQTGGLVSTLPAVPAFPSNGIARTAPIAWNRTRSLGQSFVDQQMAALLGTGGGIGGTRMMAILRAVFPGLALISGFRSGSRTLSGALSYHAMNPPEGRAVDVPPIRAVAQFIRAVHRARTRELITPWRDLDLHNGRPHFYSPAVHRQHSFAGGGPHVHWALNKGGEVPVHAFDRGGFLPPGASIAINNTGAPEPVGHNVIDYELLGAAVARHVAERIPDHGHPIEVDSVEIARANDRGNRQLARRG